jgi:NAD(P)H-dependent FMN reductase
MPSVDDRFDRINPARLSSVRIVAIVLSTTRAARFSHKAGQWIHDIAKQRDDIDVELVDLRDHPLPFFDELATNAWVPTRDPEGVRWQKC